MAQWGIYAGQLKPQAQKCHSPVGKVWRRYAYGGISQRALGRIKYGQGKDIERNE